MNDLAEITAQQHYPMARRGFVMTSLISGFTLATTVVEAQAIHTDTAGLDAGEVQIPVKDGNLPGYYARPATGTGFPVILVNEEVFGVNRYHPGCLSPPRQAGLSRCCAGDLRPYWRSIEGHRQHANWRHHIETA